MADGPDGPRARARDDWRPPFLEAFRKSGNVTGACRAAGVARSTVYEAREKDEAFAARWREAEDEAADLLEEEARRRAVDGWEEPVFYKGEQVSAVRRWDSRLLEVLLRAHKPEKYRENVKHEHTGSVSLEGLIRRARGGEQPEDDGTDDDAP